MMQGMALDLSSIDNEFCYRWICNHCTGQKKEGADPMALTWYVGCDFLWNTYANAAMAAAKKPVNTQRFEGILSIAFLGVEKKPFHHDVPPRNWKDKPTRATSLIFTGIRYLKEGAPVFGV